MDKDYWIHFWNEYAASSVNKDEQSQVLRTLNKKPISKKLWEYTLTKIDETFKVIEGDYVLDLCSGNGLISKHFVDKGALVVAVDVSKNLLNNLKDIKEIETINLDIRKLKFDKSTFDKIIIYAGIQYLNDRETVHLMHNIYAWLKPNGIVFIGDVPDLSKRWNFYDTKERQKVFYDNLLTGKNIIGNWFEREWFENLTSYIGFKEGFFLVQNKKLLNANHRFDYFYIK